MPWESLFAGFLVVKCVAAVWFVQWREEQQMSQVESRTIWLPKPRPPSTVNLVRLTLEERCESELRYRMQIDPRIREKLSAADLRSVQLHLSTVLQLERATLQGVDESFLCRGRHLPDASPPRELRITDNGMIVIWMADRSRVPSETDLRNLLIACRIPYLIEPFTEEQSEDGTCVVYFHELPYRD